MYGHVQCDHERQMLTSHLLVGARCIAPSLAIKYQAVSESTDILFNFKRLLEGQFVLMFRQKSRYFSPQIWRKSSEKFDHNLSN